jgi:predicted transglutaminase-like protease
MAEGVNVVIQIKELMDDVIARDKVLRQIHDILTKHFEGNQDMSSLPINKTQEDYDNIKRDWKGTDFTPQEEALKEE